MPHDVIWLNTLDEALTIKPNDETTMSATSVRRPRFPYQEIKGALGLTQCTPDEKRKPWTCPLHTGGRLENRWVSHGFPW